MNVKDAAARLGKSGEHIRRTLRRGRGLELGIVSAMKVGKEWEIQLDSKFMGLRRGQRESWAPKLSVKLLLEVHEPGKEPYAIAIPLPVVED